MSTTGDMRRKPPGLVFLTAVAAIPGQDRTDLVRLQSQLGEPQTTRRSEPQSVLGCCWASRFRSRPRCYYRQRIVDASTYKQNFVNLFFRLRRLQKLRPLIDTASAQRLVSASYCRELTTYSILTSLQRVLNAAARFVDGVTPRAHVSGIMKSRHWLPSAYRIRFKLWVLMQGVHNVTSPSYITDITTRISLPGHHKLRSAMTTEYDIPRTRIQVGERVFSVAGLREWNALHVDIRNIIDLSSFKRTIKTHFLCKCIFGLI